MERTESQLSRIKNHLLKGYGISRPYALNRFGSASLKQRIFDLRYEGMIIETKMVEYGGSRFARYTLNTIVL